MSAKENEKKVYGLEVAGLDESYKFCMEGTKLSIMLHQSDRPIGFGWVSRNCIVGGLGLYSVFE